MSKKIIRVVQPRDFLQGDLFSIEGNLDGNIGIVLSSKYSPTDVYYKDNVKQLCLYYDVFKITK